MKKGETTEGQVNNDFITIIVNEDLKPGYKVVQSAHALADFAVKFENEFKQWQLGSNYLCCLETSGRRLEDLMNELDYRKIKYQEFREPDIGNQITAIAVEALNRDIHKLLFKKLKLTLS